MSEDKHEFSIQLVDESLKRAEDDTFLRTNEELRREIEVLRRQLDEAVRKRNRFFQLVESALAQRDEWRRLHEDHVAARAAGLEMFEREVVYLRQLLGRAIHVINEMRSEKQEPPIELPKGLLPLDGPPVGTCEAYWERQKRLTAELRAGMTSVLDMLAERDKIAAGQ